MVGDLAFPEAPRWRGDKLWFTDMIGRRVCTTTLAGAVDTVAEFDEMPGGLGFLPDGTPLVVGTETARLYALRRNGLEVHADLRAMVDGHLDDMVVATDGSAYVGAVGVMGPNTEAAAGKIVRVAADCTVSIEAEGLAFPNGMVIIDDRVLLANETFAQRITAFDIGPDGSLSHRRVWAKLPGMHPDGLAIDPTGAVWAGCYKEEKFIRVSEGGDISETIPTPGRWAVAVELGGPDGCSLFLLTAETDFDRFFRGDSRGRIDTARAQVAAR